tara:strand:- start:2568 stop:3542 length:975 start_codon:yes stop_codon:yes gene_type:complete
MNINKNTIGKCEKKCEYSFDYPSTNLVARNKGQYISFRPEPQRESPVRFNGEKYDVKTMKLYQPSVHTFGGTKSDAELMIEHVSTTGGQRLMVCVPVDTKSNYDTILDKLIYRVSKFAPTPGGDAGEIALPNFSFDSLVPNKPYFSYKGKLPASEMNDYEYEVIVFGKEHATLITQNGRQKLQNLIKKHSYGAAGNVGIESFIGRRIIEGLDIHYNENGPNSNENGNGKDEIYIDCQPTGHSDETITIEEPSKTNNSETNGISDEIRKKNSFSNAFKIARSIILSLLAVALIIYGGKMMKKKCFNQPVINGNRDIPPAVSPINN